MEPAHSQQAIASNDAVLVFGGNYSNLEATRALLARSRQLGIPPQNIVCTGDVVGYCADPLATVEMMRRAGTHVVMGNCEEALGTSAARFAAGSTCDSGAAEWYGFSSRMLDDDARAWMRELPRSLRLEIGGRRFIVIHGGVRQIDRFHFASGPVAEKRKELDLSGCDAVLAGHCGLPFSQVIDGRLWHNAGAIGMPANDGTPRTWYSILKPVAGGLSVQSHALTYDHATAARKMRQLSLCEPYARALENGLWPDCRMLPARERRQRGTALAPAELLW